MMLCAISKWQAPTVEILSQLLCTTNTTQKKFLLKWVFYFWASSKPFSRFFYLLGLVCYRQLVVNTTEYPEWLPKGWKVEVRTRKTGVHVGKEYKVSFVCFLNNSFGIFLLSSFEFILVTFFFPFVIKSLLVVASFLILQGTPWLLIIEI